MTALGIYQILFFFIVVLALTKPIGLFMARLFEGERTFLHPLLRPLERLFYRLSGVREDVEQHWTALRGRVARVPHREVRGRLRDHAPAGLLPLNPMGFSTAHAPSNATPMTPDLAFNTAVSFMTNTNWQSYVGETTMSYFVQMAALTVQNFTSAAAGIAVAIALVRGFARQESKTIGNFWVDLTRATVYVLLPISFVAALLFASQGVIQNWDPYTQVTTRGRRDADDRAGPGRLAGSDQDAGHQRRRILQRELRASIREPDAGHDLPADRPDLRDPGRADLHVRRHGPRYAGRAGRCLRR